MFMGSLRGKKVVDVFDTRNHQNLCAEAAHSGVFSRLFWAWAFARGFALNPPNEAWAAPPVAQAVGVAVGGQHHIVVRRSPAPEPLHAARFAAQVFDALMQGGFDG
jgi:hypothetical protein